MEDVYKVFLAITYTLYINLTEVKWKFGMYIFSYLLFVLVAYQNW